jgi:hypothetical protein
MPGSVYVPIADDQARNRTLRPTLNQSLRCTFLNRSIYGVRQYCQGLIPLGPLTSVALH